MGLSDNKKTLQHSSQGLISVFGREKSMVLLALRQRRYFTRALTVTPSSLSSFSSTTLGASISETPRLVLGKAMTRR